MQSVFQIIYKHILGFGTQKDYDFLILCQNSFHKFPFSLFHEELSSYQNFDLKSSSICSYIKENTVMVKHCIVGSGCVVCAPLQFNYVK